MSVYVMGLSGSPRRGGNSELLLDQALAGAASQGARVEKVIINELQLRPCQGCERCFATGHCVVADQMSEIHNRLRQADGLILASPIYFMGLSAQTKIVIDRCQAFWAARYLLRQRHTHGPSGQRKRALLIAVAAMRRHDLFDGALATAKAFFASCDFAFDGALLYPGVDKVGDIKRHPTALREAFDAGVRLVTPREED